MVLVGLKRKIGLSFHPDISIGKGNYPDGRIIQWDGGIPYQGSIIQSMETTKEIDIPEES